MIFGMQSLIESKKIQILTKVFSFQINSSLGPLSAVFDLVASGLSHFNTIRHGGKYNMRRYRRSDDALDRARISLENNLEVFKEKISHLSL